MNDNDILAIHTIGHTTMARNAVSEVFDIESSLEARGEKAAEGNAADTEKDAGHDSGQTGI